MKDATVSVERFSGPHPAGTSGFHIHVLAPVSRARTVWTLGYQDAIACAEENRLNLPMVE